MTSVQPSRLLHTIKTEWINRIWAWLTFGGMVFILFSFGFPTHGGLSAAAACWIKLQLRDAGSRLRLTHFFIASRTLSSLLRAPGFAFFPPSVSLFPPLLLSVMRPTWFFSVTTCAHTSRSAPSPPMRARTDKERPQKYVCAHWPFPFTHKPVCTKALLCLLKKIFYCVLNWF